MKNLFLSTLLILAFMAGNTPATITVVENTSQRLSFTWQMDQWDTITAQSGSASVTSISSPHTNMVTGEKATPVLPGYSFYVGVPLSGTATISCVPMEIRTVMLNHPINTWQLKSDMLRQPGVLFTQQWVSDPAVATMAGIRTQYHVIRPFYYDEQRQSVQVLTKATVTIEFPPTVSSPAPKRPPAGEFEAMIRGMIVNWDVASVWAMPPTPLAKIKKVQQSMQLTPEKKLYQFRVGDGHKNLSEGTVDENGLIRIAGSVLVREFGNVPVRNITMYGSQKGELPTRIPSVTNLPSGIVRIPLIARGFGATIDSTGYFLAYVTGASDWEYDTAGRAFRHQLDRFDDSRTYWVMYDRGAVYDSMPGFTGVGGAMDTIRSFENHMLAKQPVKIPTDRWVNNQYEDREGTFDWSWYRFGTTGSSYSTSIPMPDIAPNTPGHLRVDLLSSYWTSTGDMTGELGSVPLAATCFTRNGQGGPVMLNPVNPIRLVYAGSTSGILPELVSFTLEWEQPLRLPASGKMTVYTGGIRGKAAYRLSGVDGAVYVVRIAPDESQMSLVYGGDPGAVGTVTWSDSTGIGVRYFVVKQSLIRSAPAGNNATVDQNTSSRLTSLRDPANTADYLVVYGAPFYNEALRLVNHKARMGRFSAAKMVCIDDVYREFSGGDVDPTALRNFLLYAKHGWTKGNQLDYVVLMGNGNYDYKHISSTEQVFIPVFLQGDGAGEICMEDYFAFLDSTLEQVRGMRIGVSIGRFTCNTSEEARIMVDKIIDVEDPAVADFGSWRNRFLAVADDDRQLEKYDAIQHTVSSDHVVTIVMNQWPSIDVRKLYLFDYPTNGNYEKPTAALALTNYFNNGFGFMNWFGHGADVLWADERLLQVRDMGSLNNYKRYPVVSSFSCTVGRFDKPGHECLNDLLVKLPRAGAIIGIASSRLAYAPANEEMGKVFYKVLFDTTVVSSTGNAYSAAKLKDVVLRSYVFLGDPSIISMKLNRRVLLKMTDEAGKPVDTIKAMQNVTVEGSVTGRLNNNPDTRFGVDKSAYAYVSVFNTADTTKHVTIITEKDQVDTHYTKYPLPGRPLFVGQTTVKDGRFSLSFLLPRNVTFDKPGIRLTAYAWQGSDVGTGFDGTKIVHGTKPLETTDTIGPRISVRPYYGAELSNRDAGATFTERITSSLPLNITIDLYDESGVDVASIGPDEGLTLEIPGQMRRQNIGNQFQYEQGDFRRGSATLVFEEERMQPGTYQMKITAQDYLGNNGVANITLEIVPKKELKLDRVFNYPNPMRMREGTKFYVYTSDIKRGSDPLDAEVSIRISTLSGKVLRVIRPLVNGEFWDGTDQRGNLLSPNIYLYQIIARSKSTGAEQTVRSQVQKLIILPPR